MFKCKMCGGDLDVADGQTTAECRYCGTQQTLPRLDDDRRANLYDRANHFRRNNEFDKAAGIYEQILAEDPDDAEAYWSRVLCRYGIEYVEDPATHRRVPTVNRAQYTSIFDDEDYKAALAKGDGAQQALYKQEAAAINEIQRGILDISAKEDPFDVFICYKETDASGRRTQDSVLANDLYHQLTQEGFKVFFSRITLEDKLGSAYEPYIFAALNSAKVMVVLGTRPEHFQAVWVRNEWSRYLALIKGGAKKALIPAYRDMDPYDLPEEFSHLQAQDMSKLGFMQDLVRGIRKIAKADEPKAAQTVVVQGGGSGADVAALLKRAYMFLEDGEWGQASEYCERVLDADPENAEAYLGELMAELRIRRREALKDAEAPFDGNDKCRKACRFGDATLRAEVEAANEHICKRIVDACLDDLYDKAEAMMGAAEDEAAYLAAAEAFEKVDDHKDAPAKARRCRELAEECAEKARADKFREAEGLEAEGTAASLKKAVAGFRELGSYNGADVRAEGAQRKLDDLQRAAGERNKKIAIVVAIVAAIAIAIALVVTQIVIPAQEAETRNSAAYEAASAKGSTEEAIAAFEELGDYKDSKQKIADIKAKREEGQSEAMSSSRVTARISTISSNVAVGSTVKLGAYEQDGNLEAVEDIEWRVLAIEDGKALLISVCGLDCKQFNDDRSKGNDFASSDLNAWLQGDFKSAAFSSDEQGKIAEITCLSVDEASRHFSLNADRVCSPTAYAKSHGAGSNGTCRWWLRSPGGSANYAAYVGSDGSVNSNGNYVDYDTSAVRPALWVNL